MPVEGRSIHRARALRFLIAAALIVGVIAPGVARAQTDFEKASPPGQVYVWTVDHGPRIKELHSLGVTGVITNDPRLFA